jgi:hypothetical protein
LHERLSCAVALVKNGAVFQEGDGHTWTVASTTKPGNAYRLNGHGCQCEDAHYRAQKRCKHALAVYLSQRVLSLMRKPPQPVVPEMVEPWPDNDPETPEPPPVAPAPAQQPGHGAQEPVQPALPEARCSVNVHVTIAGRQVQLTLRGDDETEVLERLAAVLQQYPVSAPASPQGQGQEKGWCAVHACAMKWNAGKEGRKGWYSHRVEDGSWCKGR